MDSSKECADKEYAAATPPPIDGIVDGVANAFHSVRQVFADVLRLFSLEVRRAGLMLVWMVALGVLAVVLVFTAWLGLMSALALWAVSLGMTWISAMFVIALVNLVTATLVILYCMTLSRELLFPATQRQLAMIPPIKFCGMMRYMPTRSAILTAECQLAQAKCETRENFVQVRSAVRARVAKPSSVLAMTGAGALFGVWLARRNKPQITQKGVSAWTPIAGIAGLTSSYLSRIGMQRLANMWARLRKSV